MRHKQRINRKSDNNKHNKKLKICDIMACTYNVTPKLKETAPSLGNDDVSRRIHRQSFTVKHQGCQSGLSEDKTNNDINNNNNNNNNNKISLNTGESRETRFLYQHISVLVLHFNAVLLHDSLPTVDCTD